MDYQTRQEKIIKALEDKGYLTMDERKELGLYPYSPMKPMGNSADNIER